MIDEKGKMIISLLNRVISDLKLVIFHLRR